MKSAYRWFTAQYFPALFTAVQNVRYRSNLLATFLHKLLVTRVEARHDVLEVRINVAKSR